MVYSRCLLDLAAPWYVHLRADSSPQGGRAWSVVEMDLNEGKGGKICNRLLPLSILSQRAGSAVHRGQQMLQVLDLERGSLQTTLDRTFSLLSDFGTLDPKSQISV